MASPAMLREDCSRLLPILIFGAVAAELALAATSLWQLTLSPSHPNCFATAAVLLVAAAFCQAHCGLRYGALQSRRQRKGVAQKLRPLAAGKWLLMGALVAYGIGLAIGPRPGVGFAAAAALAWWTALLLLPLSIDSRTLEHWKELLADRKPRRIGVAIYYALCLVAATELSLRVHALTDFEGGASRPRFAEGPSANKSGVSNRAGLPGMLRVALVDGLLSPGQSAAGAHLAGAGTSIEGLHVRRFSAAGSSAKADWRTELAEFEPDLVLGVVALEEGLCPVPTAGHLFDWRSMQLVKITRALTSAGAAEAAAPVVAEGDTHRLSLCRTPMDDSIKARWNRTFAMLDAFVDGSQIPGAKVALVVVPEGYQVNRVLCDMLRRRAGLESRQVDLQLPQRRLAAYAGERQIPLLDLLPYLQASGEPVYRQAEGCWNSAGQAVAARVLSGWIQSQSSTVVAATAQWNSGS